MRWWKLRACLQMHSFTRRAPLILTQSKMDNSNRSDLRNLTPAGRRFERYTTAPDVAGSPERAEGLRWLEPPEAGDFADGRYPAFRIPGYWVF